MKKILLLFLAFSNTCFGQEDRIYKSLQAAFENPQNVYHIDYSVPDHVYSSRISEEICTCKNLQSLKIDIGIYERITLPSCIHELQKLETIDFSDNNLSKLPKEIFELKQLKILNLYKNKLENIPQDIGKLNNLEELCLHKNQLKDLPQSIEKLQKLNELNI